jgi:hypothetical protein
MQSGEISFDLDDFVRRYLGKGGKLAALGEFAAELRRQLEVHVDDPRLRMNGHDFVTILAWYLSSTGLRPRTSPEEMEEILSVTLENDWLLEQTLFRGILRTFAPPVAGLAASSPGRS